MDERQLELQKAKRQVELQNLGPQELLFLARKNGINLLNSRFVIDTILNEEFPELKPPSADEHGTMSIP